MADPRESLQRRIYTKEEEKGVDQLAKWFYAHSCNNDINSIDPFLLNAQIRLYLETCKPEYRDAADRALQMIVTDVKGFLRVPIFKATQMRIAFHNGDAEGHNDNEPAHHSLFYYSSLQDADLWNAYWTGFEGGRNSDLASRNRPDVHVNVSVPPQHIPSMGPMPGSFQNPIYVRDGTIRYS